MECISCVTLVERPLLQMIFNGIRNRIAISEVTAKTND